MGWLAAHTFLFCRDQNFANWWPWCSLFVPVAILRLKLCFRFKLTLRVDLAVFLGGGGVGVHLPALGFDPVGLLALRQALFAFRAKTLT